MCRRFREMTPIDNQISGLEFLEDRGASMAISALTRSEVPRQHPSVHER